MPNDEAMIRRLVSTDLDHRRRLVATWKMGDDAERWMAFEAIAWGRRLLCELERKAEPDDTEP